MRSATGVARVAALLLALDAVNRREGRRGGHVVDDLADPAVQSQLAISGREMTNGLADLVKRGAIRLDPDGTVELIDTALIGEIAASA